MGQRHKIGRSLAKRLPLPRMNPIQAGSFLTLHYRLTGPDGADIVNTFGALPATLSLGAGQLSPA
ncbi:hypothetical protein NL393_39155, partial [Klebsiella pneumoniae]|nr:hypothetical protein [Klebsiella pneumoniae]